MRSEQNSAVSLLTLLQLQLDTAPPVVDKVNNLQILRRERETLPLLPLLRTLQAGRPEVFDISHLERLQGPEHNPATPTSRLQISRDFIRHTLWRQVTRLGEYPGQDC